MVKRVRFRVIRFVVSPDGLKMGKSLISRDDLNNYLTHSKPVICSLLMTLAKFSKNAVLALGNVLAVERRENSDREE